jgi:hypothetical protein
MLRFTPDSAGGAAAAEDEVVFGGTCDASAAWPLHAGHVAVAEDEHDMLLVYPAAGGAADRHVDVDAALGQEKPKDEADFEAVAALDRRLYWITGHGRNSDGEPEPDRRRVLATSMTLEPQGRAVTGLTDALRLRGLEAAIGPDDAVREDLAAEADGLNIEALAAEPSAPGTLLIGLRNPPAADGGAIVVPFANPAAAVDAGEAPALGEPFSLDLRGRGLRDMVWSPAHGTMLLLGGAKGNAEQFALFSWSGRSAEIPKLVTEIAGLNPEAIVAWEDSRRVLLLSDDGDRRMQAAADECRRDFSDGTCPCKRLKGAAAARQEFRGRWLDIP